MRSAQSSWCDGAPLPPTSDSSSNGCRSDAALAAWTRSRMARFGSSAADDISCPVTGDRGGPLPCVASQPSMALRSYVCPSAAITGSCMRSCRAIDENIDGKDEKLDVTGGRGIWRGCSIKLHSWGHIVQTDKAALTQHETGRAHTRVMGHSKTASSCSAAALCRPAA